VRSVARRFGNFVVIAALANASEEEPGKHPRRFLSLEGERNRGRTGRDLRSGVWRDAGHPARFEPVVRINAPAAYVILYVLMYAAFGVASPFWPEYFRAKALNSQ